MIDPTHLRGRAASLPAVPGLDGLRGLAVLAVIAFHMWPDAVPGGWLGVDVFFVLSGYLITSLLLVELGRGGRVGLGGFWSRRAKRLLPAVLVVIAATVLAARQWLLSWEQRPVRLDALSTLAYVANWRFIAAGDSYFAESTISPLRHMWSLAIEEQFYLVWPVVLWGLWRLLRGNRRSIGFAAFGLAGLSAVAMLVVSGGVETARAYYGTDTRAQALLIGAGLAAWATPARDLGPRLASLARYAAPAGWVVLVAMAALVDGDESWLYWGGFTVIALASAGLVVGTRVQGPVQELFNLEALRAVGRVSYGLYLWHWPVIVFLTPDTTGVDGFGLAVLQIVVFTSTALASYFLIERPIRWQRVAPRFVGIGSVLAVLATASVVGVGLRSAEAAPGVLQQEAGTVVSLGEGQAEGPVMLVGDDLAAAIAPELAQRLDGRRRELVDATKPGCGIVAGPAAGPDNRCDPDSAVEQSRLLRAENVEEVVLLSRWEATQAVELGGEAYPPGSDEWRKLLSGELTTTIERIRQAGAEPRLAVPPRIPMPAGTDAEAEAPGTASDAWASLLRQVATSAGVALVDLSGVACGLGSCPPVSATRPAEMLPEAAASLAERLTPVSNGDLSVWMMGDSIGLTMGFVRDDLEGLTVRGGGVMGCGVLDTSRCSADWRDLWRRAGNQGVDVAVASLGAWEVEDSTVDGEAFEPGTRRAAQMVRSGLEGALGLLPPDLPMILLEVPCMRANDDVSYVSEDRLDWVNEIFDDFASAHPSRVARVPLSDFLCENGRPRSEVDGVTLRKDGRHYTEASSKLVWDQHLVDQVRSVLRS